jgi:hypothetical protein
VVVDVVLRGCGGRENQ